MNDPKKVLLIVPRQYLPHLTGGLEITANETCLTLQDIGWNVSVAAKSPPQGHASLKDKFLRRVLGPYFRKDIVGKPSYHCFTDLWHPVDLEKLVARERPQVIVCHVAHSDDVVRKVAELDLPTFFYVHSDHKSSELTRAAQTVKKCLFAAESGFIATLTKEMTGKDVLILPPLIDPTKYRVNSIGEEIAVINPHYQKGGDVVVEVASRLQHRRFIVAGGWSNAAGDTTQLQIESTLSTLPNVTRIRHLTDVRLLFRRARLLFMPCRVAEAFGRAAAESQISGIPVVASNRGALPETVGRGGKCIPFDSTPEFWAEEIEKLFEDEAYFLQLRRQSFENAAQTIRQPYHFRQQLKLYLEELCAY